jgi:hypothetical protein
MENQLTFTKKLSGFSLSMIAFLLIIFLNDYFSITYYGYDADPVLWKDILGAFIWKIPFILIFVWLSKNDTNKMPVYAGVGVLAAFVFLKIVIQLLPDMNDWHFFWYWYRVIGLALSFGLYGFLKFKDAKGWYMFLVPLVYSGMSLMYGSYEYLETWSEGFRFIGVDIPRTDEINNWLSLIIVAITYIPFFYISYIFMRSIENNKRFNIRLTRVDMKESPLSTPWFSLIFWTFRIYIFVILFGAYSYLDYVMEDDFSVGNVVRILMIAFGLFVFISMYRNLLVKYMADRSRFPAWQFLGLNIPIINFFTWIFLLSSPETPGQVAESSIDDDLLDESIDEPKGELNMAGLKQSFLDSNKNQSIKVLIVVLVVINLLVSFIAASGYGNSEMLVVVVVSAAISIGIIVWYFNSPSAAFILLFIILGLSLIVYFLGSREFTPKTTLLAMVNIVLYYALFHFDKMEFYVPKQKADQLDDE